MFSGRIVRRDEQLLLVAIVALLIAGVASLIVLPKTGIHPLGAPEAGALLAPPSDQSLTEAFGAPGTPTGGFDSGVNGGNAGTGGGSNAPQPKPNNPGEQPGPTTSPPPPPPNQGLLPDLPLLPPLPPPLGSRPGTAHASAHASVKSLIARGLQ